MQMLGGLFSGPCLHESQPRVVTKGRRVGSSCGHPEVARASHAHVDPRGWDGHGHWLGRAHQNLQRNEQLHLYNYSWLGWLQPT